MKPTKDQLEQAVKDYRDAIDYIKEGEMDKDTAMVFLYRGCLDGGLCLYFERKYDFYIWRWLTDLGYDPDSHIWMPPYLCESVGSILNSLQKRLDFLTAASFNTSMRFLRTT